MAVDSPSTIAPVHKLQRHDAALPELPARRRWPVRSLATAVAVAAIAILVVTALAYSRHGMRRPLTYVVSRGNLRVTVTAQGMLESSENEEIKCKVRGRNTVTWVIDSGTFVRPGDLLVQLDTRFIQEQIDERTKYAHWSRSAAERSAATVRHAELAIQEYEQGQFITQVMTLQKDIAIAQSRLRSSQDMLKYALKMAKSGYINELEVEEKSFAVRQAELDLDVKRTRLDVLRTYTRKERLQSLQGEFAAIQATHKANVERAQADASRRDRAVEELKHCTVRAERAGLVIHPNAARWENAPEIYEGTTVYKDRIMLLMPNLKKMQVKVGIHEAVVDRVEVGMKASVRLPNRTLQGEVTEIASVTRPAGWWTGNEVRYDTRVKLPAVDGLLPGMSAEVEIVVAEYDNALKLPVAAIATIGKTHYCWAKGPDGFTRRQIVLGDTNGIYTIVTSGISPGDEILLDPPVPAGSER